jgi:hypothetical protein
VVHNRAVRPLRFQSTIRISFTYITLIHSHKPVAEEEKYIDFSVRWIVNFMLMQRLRFSISLYPHASEMLRDV